MSKPFRFGVQTSRLPTPDWRGYLEKLEKLGYSSILFPDHFGDQLEPLSAIAAALAATEKLRAGALVLDVDYRHPVVAAKAAAGIQILSAGRLEFGIGAGWMKSDYDQAGLQFDPPGVRVERLAEALAICKSMWTEERFSYEGKHYSICDIQGEAKALEQAGYGVPRILVGGGGKRVLTLAGQFADIVGINPALPEGRITARTASDLTASRAAEKAEWVRDAASRAGRDPAEIEFSCLVFVVSMVEDPSPIESAIASTTGMEKDEVAGSPLFLVGPPARIKEKLLEQKEKTGISYVIIQDMATTPPGTIERFAEEVVGELAGSDFD